MPRDRIPVFQAVRGHGGREREKTEFKGGSDTFSSHHRQHRRVPGSVPGLGTQR